MVLCLPNTRLAIALRDSAIGQNSVLNFFEMCHRSYYLLAKRIYVTCSALPGEDPSHLINSFAYRMIYICDKFSDRIEFLEISIQFEDCLHVIFEILKKRCPKLQRLEITDYLGEVESDRSGAILPAPLLPRPNMTLFKVVCEKGVTPLLTTLIQLVVHAAPNLKKVTIPWGFCADFGNSKFLDSLSISLNLRRPMDDAMADFNPAELSRMLAPVADQLVTLRFERFQDFGHQRKINFKNSNPTRFSLPGYMLKLKNFQNEMIDIFQDDPLEDIEGLPALKSLRIGTIFAGSRRVEEILKVMYEKKMIWENVKTLGVFGMHDPKLLKGLKTAFPNLEELEVNTWEDHSREEVSVMSWREYSY